MKFHRDNFKLKSFNMKRSKTWNKWLNEINDTFQVLWRVSSHVKPKLLKGTFHKLRTQLSKWYMIYLVLANTFISHHSRFLHKWCTNCCRNEINILFFLLSHYVFKEAKYCKHKIWQKSPQKFASDNWLLWFFVLATFHAL